MFFSPFEDSFASAKEDREVKEERGLSDASFPGIPFFVAVLPPICETEIANASSAWVSSSSEEEVSESTVDYGFLRKCLGFFLSFLFFSFSLLSLLDLESLGILSKLTSPLVCVTSVLRR